MTYLSLILSTKIDLSIVLMSINGFIAGLCAFIYVYAAAFVPKKYVGLLSTVFMAYDGLTTFTQAVYYRYISNDYKYYFYCITFESFLIAITGTVYLLEYPSYLE